MSAPALGGAAEAAAVEVAVASTSWAQSNPMIANFAASGLSVATGVGLTNWIGERSGRGGAAPPASIHGGRCGPLWALSLAAIPSFPCCPLVQTS